MSRRPQISTLFPYTTLFRSSEGSGLGSSSTVTVGALHAMHAYLGEMVPAERLAREACAIEIETLKRPIRSEEHTSELQSRLHLVCRLLLEKKNKKETNSTAD